MGSSSNRRGSLSLRSYPRHVRRKPLDTILEDAVVADVRAEAYYWAEDRFERLLRRKGTTEKDAMEAFAGVEINGKIPSTKRAKAWLKGALSCGFEHLSEKILSSWLTKGSTLQDLLQFVATKSPKVFEILLVRENTRGLRDRVRFVSNISDCLHIVCAYDQPHAPIAYILSIVERMWDNQREGPSIAVANVRGALMQACFEGNARVVLQLIDVPFWHQLEASYVYGNASLRERLEALQLSDELQTRLKDLGLLSMA